jgi:tRNA(Ile)-lysidine synthase
MELKNNIQKPINLLSKKLNMSLKNLNAIKIPKNLKLKLSNKKIQRLFNNFEKNFNIQEAFIVAVSGGPDSLALAFLTKIYSIKYNLNLDILL